MTLSKKEREELLALGVDTPDDADLGVEGGGVMQLRGGQVLISTSEDGWRKRYLKAYHGED